MNSQKRLLLTLKYLWNKTDEEHPATLKDIGEYLQQNSIETTRKTLQADIHLLTEFGIDVICNHSTQNQYHRRLHKQKGSSKYRRTPPVLYREQSSGGYRLRHLRQSAGRTCPPRRKEKGKTGWHKDGARKILR